jgi:hypothetical protein
MAQTHNVRPLNSDSDANGDAEAWRVTAAARKYRIYDGKVWSGGAGMLFSLDPLPGFASLPDALRPLVFQSVAQFVTNRVGQTAEGDVQAAVSKCLTDGTMPGANTNDAFERHYLNVVTERVNAARPLAKDATSEQKAAHEAIINATAIKARGGIDGQPNTYNKEEGKFIEFRDAGIAAARNKPVTEKKRQPKKAASLDAAVEL